MSEKVIDKGNLSEFEKKLCEKVEERRDEIVELLKDLISIDSRSYDWREFSDMHKVFEFAQNYMEKIGFETELYKAPHRLEEENKGKKEWPNLLAYIKSKDYEGSTESEGKKGGKFLQFNGHLDIVPYREEHWDEDLSPLKAVVKDGKIYGRGTCDMKGGLAAQMIACKLF